MSNYRLENLTPHQVVLINKEGKPIVLPPCEQPARLKEEEKKGGEIRGIQVNFVEYTGTINLPAPKKGVVFIVSGMVRRANADRCDLFSPDTSKRVTNKSGLPVKRGSRAVTGLVGNPVVF